MQLDIMNLDIISILLSPLYLIIEMTTLSIEIDLWKMGLR